MSPLTPPGPRPGLRPDHLTRVRRYGERRPFMRLACSPFARAAPPARSRPTTHTHTRDPRAGDDDRGLNARRTAGFTAPRRAEATAPEPIPWPIRARPLVAPSPCCCRCRAPQVGSHYRARPNSAGRGHSAARDPTASRPRPLRPRPHPRARKTASERDRASEGEGRALLHAAAAPGFTAPRAAGSASGAQETPPSSCFVPLEKPSITVVCTAALLPRVGSRAAEAAAARDARARPFAGVVLFPAVVAEV